MGMPTYKEFRNVVYKKYMARMKNYDQDEVKEYFKSDEASQEIRNAYEYNSRRFEEGKLNEEIFVGDAANSVANCLTMMF